MPRGASGGWPGRGPAGALDPDARRHRLDADARAVRVHQRAGAPGQGGPALWSCPSSPGRWAVPAALWCRLRGAARGGACPRRRSGSGWPGLHRRPRRCHRATDLHEDPADAGRRGAERVAARASGWWLDIDLDVLDGQELSACGAAGDPAMPGGCRGPSWALWPHRRWVPVVLVGGARVPQANLSALARRRLHRAVAQKRWRATSRVICSGSSPSCGGRLWLSQRVASPWTSDQAATAARTPSSRPLGLLAASAAGG
jgi:hypothetical protein